MGLVTGFAVLSGDELGQVNLLFLLMLFGFLPVIGLLLSLGLLLRGGGRGLAGWMLELPVWPKHLTTHILTLGISGSRNSWLFYQTQILTLCFAFGGLLIYFLLLLGTDINFVWRSTLLEANDILPLLEAIALPWTFWNDAQPSLELLQQTQDFRISELNGDVSNTGRWWQYIFAAQCTYNLIPRSIMLMLARRRYLGLAQHSEGKISDVSSIADSTNTDKESSQLASVTTSLSQAHAIVNWAGAPISCLNKVADILGDPVDTFEADPLTESIAMDSGISCVVLVKSWEPPLGELRDYLNSLTASGEKVILPMDWDENSLVPIKDIHQHEWRRFCGTLENWQVLLPEFKS